MMGFLAALPSEYDSVKAQIMASNEILSFQETFGRISSALVGWNNGESETQQYINSGPGGNSRGTSSGGVVCY